MKKGDDERWRPYNPDGSQHRCKNKNGAGKISLDERLSRIERAIQELAMESCDLHVAQRISGIIKPE